MKNEGPAWWPHSFPPCRDPGGRYILPDESRSDCEACAMAARGGRLVLANGSSMTTEVSLESGTFFDFRQRHSEANGMAQDQPQSTIPHADGGRQGET